MDIHSTEEVIALRYMQRGPAKRKRVQRYRKNRQRAKMQGKRWRQKNRGHIKRYRQRAQRNPMKHRLKRRAEAEVAIDNIVFFDYFSGLEGQVFALDTEEAEVLTTLGTYGIDVFVNRVVFPDEAHEAKIFGLLDSLATTEPYDYDRSLG